jgi:hypothetical protein
MCCLIPVRLLSGESVDHAVRQDGTEHHDRLTMPTCGASGKQGHDMEPSPLPSMSRRGAILVIVYTTSGTRPSEKKDDMAPGVSSSRFFLFLLSLSLSYPRSFRSIKGKAERPNGGRLRNLSNGTSGSESSEQSQALQLHFTRGFGSHLSLARL